MKDDFINFLELDSLKDVKWVSHVLSTNNIQFEIFNNSQHFDLNPSNINPLDNHYIINILKTDFQKALELTKSIMPITNSSNELSFIHSLSIDDLMEMVVYTKEWSDSEIAEAQRILKQHNIVIPKDFINKAQEIQDKQDKIEELKENESFIKGYNIFIYVGFLSIISSYNLFYKNEITNFASLGIIEFINSNFETVSSEIKLYINLSISICFLIIWYKSRKLQKSFYFLGIAIYISDTFLILISQNYQPLIVHLFLLASMLIGYFKITRYKNSLIET